MDLERGTAGGFPSEAVTGVDGDCRAHTGGGRVGCLHGRGLATLEARGDGLGPELLGVRPCILGAGAGAGAPAAGAASCDEDEVACADACADVRHGGGGAVAGTADIV